MARYIDLNNPKIIHMGRDKYGNCIYHIPPDLPTADVRENARGRWTLKKAGGWHCSECGVHAPFQNLSDYCPNCGALMKGEEDGQLNIKTGYD